MADVVSSEVRSRMMAGIRGKNTKPELLIRRGLHRLGFRYRIHAKYLPGKPDILLPKYRAAIFVHGCFWHGHDCDLFKWPKTREQFWRDKIEGNRLRDRQSIDQLTSMGFRVRTVWECELRNARANIGHLIDELAVWLRRR